MILLKIALRNLFRHRIRSLINILMIAGSFSAIIIFLGFSNHMLRAIEVANVKSVYGHIQIGKTIFWERQPVDRQVERLLDDPAAIIQTVKTHSKVKYASPRLSFFSLLSTGDRTTSGQGWGLDPAIEKDFVAAIPIVEGKNFSGQQDAEVLIGVGLQKQMQAKVGEFVTIVGQTAEGAANAIDADLVGVFQTGVAEIDNTTFITTLKSAQKLLDTQLAERILIMLEDGKSLDKDVAILANLNKDLAGVEVRSWKSLSKLYQQVVEYYNVQNSVINVILAVLVLLGIINTVGMSIYERTLEIGTCRALGDRRRDVLTQFSIEGLALFLVSLLVALPVSSLLVQLINRMKWLIDMPGASMKIAIEISPYPMAYFQALVVVFVATMVATLIPAWNASRIPIVEALRK
jgi:putative ABC transport system permease protein